MWHIFSDGFGGFLVYESDPMGDALGDGMLMALFAGIAALFAWLIWVMGDAIMLPLACLVLLLMLGLLGVGFGIDSEISMTAMSFAAMPIIMYAWGCLCWGMMYVFDHAEQGYLAFIAYLLAGVFMLAMMGGFAQESDIPILGVIFAVSQLVIWWAAMGARSYGNEGVAFVLKYTFRVLGIVSLVCLAIVALMAIWGLFKAASHPQVIDGKNFAWNLGTVAMSVAPVLVCGHLGGIGGVVPGIAMLVLYAVLAGTIVALQKEGSGRLAGLAIAYLAFFFCYLITRADLSIAIPLDAGNAVIDTLCNSELTRVMGSMFEVVGASLAELFATVTYFALSLAFRIFDSQAPYIPFNETMSGLLGFAALCWSISIGASVMVRARR